MTEDLHPTPVFIMSMPRAGSTLLQRLLATHSTVATAPEPWFLLPVLAAHDTTQVAATYDHALAVRAMHEFADGLPEGDRAFDRAVEAYGRAIHRLATPSRCTHFLDKTPRYHTRWRELMRAFPDARFLLLHRNPVAVANSLVSTFLGGRMRLNTVHHDLYAGQAALCELAACDSDQVHALRYEDLVREPIAELERIASFLEIDLDAEQAVERLGTQTLEGSLGDPERTERNRDVIRSVQQAPEPRALRGWLRRRWCRNYLCWIGSDRLATMGYEAPDVLAGALPGRRAPHPLREMVDFGDLVRSRLLARTEAHLVRRSLARGGLDGAHR